MEQSINKKEIRELEEEELIDEISRGKDIYDKILEYQVELHHSNRKRIKGGLWCLLIIPIIFMILMFITGSSKLVFLVMWIGSLFGISVYLIAVEYADYKIQEKINEIYGREVDIEGLIDPEKIRRRAGGNVDE